MLTGDLEPPTAAGKQLKRCCKEAPAGKKAASAEPQARRFCQRPSLRSALGAKPAQAAPGSPHRWVTLSCVTAASERGLAAATGSSLTMEQTKRGKPVWPCPWRGAFFPTASPSPALACVSPPYWKTS